VKKIKAKTKKIIAGLTTLTAVTYLLLQEKAGNGFSASAVSEGINIPGVLLASTGLIVVVCLVRQN